MKLSRTIWVVDDEGGKISVKLTYDKMAVLNQEKIKDQFELWVDDIYGIFQKRFHTFAIKMSG